MKTFLKILLAIVIVIGICIGIYCILPETSQMFIKGNIQYRTDDTAKTQIDKIKKDNDSRLRQDVRRRTGRSLQKQRVVL